VVEMRVVFDKAPDEASLHSVDFAEVFFSLEVRMEVVGMIEKQAIEALLAFET
jgi:hypothetical protein